MQPISIAGTALTTQPSDVDENPIYIKTDQTAIDGTMQRNQINKKRQSKMQWTYIDAATYQYLMGLMDAGNAVTYTNTASNVSGGTLTFTGLIDVQQSGYIRGSSALVPFQLVIREV